VDQSDGRKKPRFSCVLACLLVFQEVAEGEARADTSPSDRQQIPQQSILRDSIRKVRMSRYSHVDFSFFKPSLEPCQKHYFTADEACL
jgi:hypothetical protein